MGEWEVWDHEFLQGVRICVGESENIVFVGEGMLVYVFVIRENVSVDYLGSRL